MRNLATVLLLLFSVGFSRAQSDDNKVMIIIIDGARYTETFGDPQHTYIPEMWRLAGEGTIGDKFYNNGITVTAKAIPALWCGAWTAVLDTVYQGSSTNYAQKPTIFEYFRKDKQAPSEECFYLLKYIADPWLPSFDADYGPEYWPELYSDGATDDDVAENAKSVIDDIKPHFLWVYLADVDHAGHSGDWENYTSTIVNADRIVGELWDYLQADPFYKDQTTLFVTNDHGRHDDQHGGFQNHGCGCEGCRHIEFLAVGPNVKKGFVSDVYRTTPDFAVTASFVLGVDPAKATGNVMYEIFENEAVESYGSSDNLFFTVAPNPADENSVMTFTLQSASKVSVVLSNIYGNVLFKGGEMTMPAGKQTLSLRELGLSGNLPHSGMYFLTLNIDNAASTLKIIF
jgi:hypothetical protein